MGRLPWEHTVVPRDSWRAGEGSASADQPGRDLPTIKADKLVPPNWLFLQAPVSAFTQANLKSLSLAKTLLPLLWASSKSLSEGVRAALCSRPWGCSSLLSHTQCLPENPRVSVIYFFLISCLLISCCLSDRRANPFPQELCRAVRWLRSLRAAGAVCGGTDGDTRGSHSPQQSRSFT